MAKKENTTSIGFEEVIWRAADKLRGNLSASEYEGVVLGLIFLILSLLGDLFRIGDLLPGICILPVPACCYGKCHHNSHSHY